MRTDTVNNIELQQWTPQEVHDAMQKGEIVLIDVRTPQEYAFEHIEGALLAPMHTFQPKSLPGQSDKQIVFHCGSGMRSARVAQEYGAIGQSPLAHLEGGFAAWKAAGLPYIGIDLATGAPKRAQA